MLVAILMTCVISVSAADINANNAYDNANDIDNLQSDFESLTVNNNEFENLKTASNTEIEDNYHINTALDSQEANLYHGEYRNSTDNLKRDIITDASAVSKIDIISNSAANPKTGQINNAANSNDELPGIEIPELFNSTSLCKITQTSKDTFKIKTTEKEYTLMRFYVDSEESLNKASQVIYNNYDPKYDIILLDFKDNLNLVDYRGRCIIDTRGVDYLIIRGFNAKISPFNPSESNEDHLICVNPQTTVFIRDLTITGFNTAIYNYGMFQASNVVFDGNRVKYFFEKDYGGAIRNYGVLKCIDCTFKNNYAKYGGAVYNELGSQSVFMETKFSNNNAYGSTDTILSTNDNKNIYCCKGASCSIIDKNRGDDDTKRDTGGNIYIANIKNTYQLYNFIYNYGKERGHVKCIYINFEKGSYCINYDTIKKEIKNRMTLYEYLADQMTLLNFLNAETVYINGNGAEIAIYNSPSNECKFLAVHEGTNCLISNIKLTGFNRAIMNYGTTNIENSMFYHDKCNYEINEDYGGAIYNEGTLTISKSKFSNCYAKHGGAIYNEKGIVSCYLTTFTSNEAYGNGGAIYNNKGLLSCTKCDFDRNKADKGGSIFNHYGLCILDHDSFYKSEAKEGGSIYNDYANVTVKDTRFINSKAEKGKEILNYGDSAKCIIIGDSFTVDIAYEMEYHALGAAVRGNIFKDDLKKAFEKQREELEKYLNSITKTPLQVSTDGPDEALRWGIRAAEIGIGLTICVGATLCGLGPLASFFVCTLGGSLLAAAEEAIEEIYFEHNFNFYNCAVMAVFAGVLDGIAGSIGSKIGDTLLKDTSKRALKLALLEIALDAVGEVITEVVPRIDFSDDKLPDTMIEYGKQITDGSNPFIHENAKNVKYINVVAPPSYKTYDINSSDYLPFATA